MRRRTTGEDGAAAVEFVLVGGLLLFLFMGVVQVGLVLHMRNVIAASAAEGARNAASLGHSAGSGGARANQLIRSSLSGEVARGVTCSGARDVLDDGSHVMRVDCQGQLPISFLPLGHVRIHLTARSLQEEVR